MQRLSTCKYTYRLGVLPHGCAVERCDRVAPGFRYTGGAAGVRRRLSEFTPAGSRGSQSLPSVMFTAYRLKAFPYRLPEGNRCLPAACRKETEASFPLHRFPALPFCGAQL